MWELVILKGALFLGMTGLLAGYAAIALAKVLSTPDEKECEGRRTVGSLSIEARFYQLDRLRSLLTKAAAWCLIAFACLLCLLFFKLVATTVGRFT